MNMYISMFILDRQNDPTLRYNMLCVDFSSFNDKINNWFTYRGAKNPRIELLGIGIESRFSNTPKKCI